MGLLAWFRLGDADLGGSQSSPVTWLPRTLSDVPTPTRVLLSTEGTLRNGVFHGRSSARNDAPASTPATGGRRMDKHIFVAEKGDYDDIADGIPQHAH